LVSASSTGPTGELARIRRYESRGGHLYDYYSDALVNSLIFAAAGLGARHGWLGVWPRAGVLATIAMLVCWVVGELYQELDGSGHQGLMRAAGVSIWTTDFIYRAPDVVRPDELRRLRRRPGTSVMRC